jgi:nicotinate-nucleotide pyrophosphorylase (carboxylating)
MTEERPVYAHLLPPSWATQVTAWLAEDTPSFDWGGFVVGESPREAHLFAKSSGILAGVPFFDEVFKQLQCTVKWNYSEGDWIDTTTTKKVVVAVVNGPVRNLLLGERVALNTLARCSGIATASHLFSAKAREAGFKGIVAGTRKTTPGENRSFLKQSNSQQLMVLQQAFDWWRSTECWSEE